MGRTSKRHYLPAVVRVTAPARPAGEFRGVDETPTWRIVARRAVDAVALNPVGADTRIPATEPLDVVIRVPSWTFRIDARTLSPQWGWGTVPSATHPVVMVELGKEDLCKGWYSTITPLLDFGVQ